MKYLNRTEIQGEIILVSEYFTFIKLDLADREAMSDLFSTYQFDIVINLGAQAGVRYSIENPNAYIDSNVVGFVNILEGCRHHDIKHLIYASSSSVYGMNIKQPFTTADCVDFPISLYAATKKSNELMAHSYSHLYNIPTTGLRFFTVYGPWGRPDMALFMYRARILKTNGKCQKKTTTMFLFFYFDNLFNIIIMYSFLLMLPFFQGVLGDPIKKLSRFSSKR